MAVQIPNSHPADLLNSMIAGFYFPEGRDQSVEQIEAAMEQIAIAYNATRIGPDGKPIGRMRDSRR